MCSFDDTRRIRVFAYTWYSRAAEKNAEVAADRIRIRSSLLTSNEADKDEKNSMNANPRKCIDALTNAGLILST
jgi:hypothetical protein